MVSDFNMNVSQKLQILFRNAHAFAKQNRPSSDFILVSDLNLKKGLIAGETYINKKSAKMFQSAIVSVEQKQISNMIKEANIVAP